MAVLSSDDVAAMGPLGFHPTLGHLILLIFEAILEVVCVSLPGYIVARQGMFDADSQKFLANLNVALFTPCLVFTKLASQLTAGKLIDLAVIPVIFIVQTLVAYLTSLALCRLCGFEKRPRNFVVAMSVFANSNSLPISLVISLSKTLNGLHWDRIPGDNDDEVAARGILYLLIFQQLGQLLRWSWGFHVLLAPAKRDDDDDDDDDDDEREDARLEYHDDVRHDAHLVSPVRSRRNSDDLAEQALLPKITLNAPKLADAGSTPANRNVLVDHHPSTEHPVMPVEDDTSAPSPNLVSRGRLAVGRARGRIAQAISRFVDRLPKPVQRGLARAVRTIRTFVSGVRSFMNPPLWAMLIAIVVASVPALQRLFFTPGTFIHNSVTSAVRQSGGVAVPLILVVLGANLARNTVSPTSAASDDPQLNKRLLVASLVGRMVLPTVVMAPLLALSAKYIPVSILDDPIFVVVCFLLTGAPSALQLAQICQINQVYETVMSRLLFQSYVIWILPSTLVLVTCALEVVRWANAP